MKDIIHLKLRSLHGESESDDLGIVSVQTEEKLGSIRGVLQMRVRYVVGRDAISHGRRATTFGASYSRYDSECLGGSAKLTNGAFYVDPECLRSRGIGTYVMDRIVEWVQKHAPDARVHEIVLADDTEPANCIRKPRVYENVGIEFVGRRSKPMSVSALRRVNPDRLLKEIDIYSLLEKIRLENKNLKFIQNNHKNYAEKTEVKLTKRFWKLFG